ncbi:MAG: transporter substrate-binding domain-containing protein [Chloroflexi bacterium]|nr:transporter substrate-binding domain-containing protein [Chloroflexota bacterium]
MTALLLVACELPSIELDTIARIAATPNAAVNQPTPTAAPATISTAFLVKERSKLRVGVRFDAPRLSSVTSDGQLEGLDIDLAREFARRWLGSTDNVEFVQVTSTSAPKRIEQREVDMAMGGLIHSRQAETHADFTLSYAFDGEALLARTGSYADFGALAQRSVTYIDIPSISALSNAQIAANITVSLQTAQSYALAIQQLRDGQTDAVAGRWRRLRLEVAEDPALTILTVFQREPVAIMLPQNDSDWADLVNITLSALVSDGTYAIMYQKWFKQPPEPVTPLAGTIDLQLATLPDAITLHNSLDQIRTTTSVRIGFIAQADPLATLDTNGQPTGFEIDLCRELAQRWFQNQAAAQFTIVAPGDIANLLNNGTIDLAVGGIVRTQANERLMDFSSTYYNDVGIALPVNNSALRDFVNLTLQEIIADGTYARIYEGWFGSVAPELERWPGETTQNMSVIAPTATSLPSPTPVFEEMPTATPQPPTPTAPPSAETPTPGP